MSASKPHSELRDFLHRLSEWDVLNLPAGSGSDGPYWQGEIRVAQEALTRLVEQLETLRSLLQEITERPVYGLWSDQDLVDRTRAALNPASEPQS